MHRRNKQYIWWILYPVGIRANAGVSVISVDDMAQTCRYPCFECLSMEGVVRSVVLDGRAQMAVTVLLFVIEW